MSRQRGSVTLWMLGLSLLLLLFGGLAVDFWRALAVQRELAAVADSAVVAAASGIDEVHYRTSGEVVLDPTRARALALASISSQAVAPDRIEVTVAPDRSTVVVALTDNLDLGLLGVLVDSEEPLVVRVTASAVPRLVP